jgi:hypothetical protein
LPGSGQVPVAGSCEYGNEPLGSIKPEEYFLAEQLLASQE